MRAVRNTAGDVIGLAIAAEDHPDAVPSMMVALLLYAYARGNRSSRGIERACVEDVAYRVVAGNLAPDHSTIAEFSLPA